MDAGVLILGGAFGGAAVLVGDQLRRRGATAARLSALGFEAAPEHVAAVRRRFTELACGRGEARPRTWHLTTLLAREAEGPRVHHLQATDLDTLDRQDVWLVERANPAVEPAVSVLLAPPGPGTLRAWLRRRVLADPWGASLELPAAREEARPILAAFAERGGRLTDVLPEHARARLAAAARHGFVAAHFGEGRAAFTAAPDRRNVTRQWRWVASWLPGACG